jgi:mRNA interferase MazF
MKRGDVFIAQLAPRSGSEQQGTRPVIVVSHNAFNRASGWASVIVVPVSTSSVQASRGPTAIALPAGAGGLRKTSVAVCHQVTTLDRAKLFQHIGQLNAQLMSQVDAGLKAALQLI